jgi:hypothetical protein
MLQLYTHVSSVCSQMFQLFQMYAESVLSRCCIYCNAYTHMLQTYVSNVSAVSDVYCRKFFILQVFHKQTWEAGAGGDSSCDRWLSPHVHGKRGGHGRSLRSGAGAQQRASRRNNEQVGEQHSAGRRISLVAASVRVQQRVGRRAAQCRQAHQASSCGRPDSSVLDRTSER